MSYRKEKKLALAGMEFKDKTFTELSELFKESIESGTHGFCYSAYEEGQEPGHILTEEQIRRRITILAPHTKWIRTFSCIEGNELIPKIAHEYGLKTMVGAWLGKDKDLNELEIEGLIQLAKEGYVDIAAVGNEVLYRNDLTEDELLDFMNQVKNAIPTIPMGYVDAYYEFTVHPKITEACDVILANCYPFWEGCHMDYSLLYMKQMYHQALNAGKGKKVIITETGWPSEGTPCKETAHPSKENALKYFLNAQQWSQEENIDLFYFTSFDESWKVGSEGDVGAFWGIWNKDENFKY